MTQQSKFPPPLRLISHFYTEFRYKANPETSPEKLENGEAYEMDTVTLRGGVGDVSEDLLKFQVTLQISSPYPEKEKAWDFYLEVVGIFEIAAAYPKDKWESLKTNFAPSMLYGAAREYLCTVTSRGPYAPVYLPTIHIPPQPIVKEENAQIKESKDNIKIKQKKRKKVSPTSDDT
ncbi:protein-export chaperone SecB [Desulfovibrio sp. JY]|nr:protein-export chaperone SecB [Desulfovibrio sp. JY]